MKIDHLVGKFTEDFYNSIDKINNEYRNALSYKKEGHHMDSEFELYSKLVKFFVETDENPYSLVSGWGGFKDSAQTFDAFLSVIHHACIDDGDMCWVNSRVQGTILVFVNHHDLAGMDISKVVSEYYKNEECTVHPLYLSEHFDEWRQASADHEKKQMEIVKRLKEWRAKGGME